MKISIQKGLFIFLLFNLKFICFTQSNAQSDINFLPESPNSKSFAKYGKYDVNMYNGVPNINIPIFEDNNNFNISLNYNINQVKPSTVPNWVGLGWHLNIGGSVTRIINGQPDEYYQNFLLPENKLSYFDNYSKLDTDQWAANSALSNFYNSGFIYGKRIPVLIPFPDEFVINIMGITGSFYMNEKGKWIGRTRDGKTFTIEHIYKSDYKLNDFFSFPEQAFKRNLKRILYGFNIIMDDGTKYVFGQDENAVEFSTNISLDASLNSIDSYNSDIIPTSWSIVKIISPKGKELKFEYQRDQKPTFVPNLAGSILKYRKKSSPGNSQALFSSEPAKGMARLYNTYLTKVQSENFTINLYRSLSNTLQYDPTDYLYETSQRYFGNVINYRNSWYKLDNLTIEDSSKKIIKNIEFTFNNQSNERLHLNKVVINNEAYSFLYNSKQLPNYTSFQKDGWGYYNGYKSPDSFNAINATPEEYEKETEQADYPNLQFAKAETLEKIIYPTGGSSSFDYELNDYSKYGDKDINYSKLKISDINTPNNLAGGLRIKNIKSCPENNSTNCITKAYSYLGDNGISSGILPYKIQHFTKATGDNYNIWEFSTSSYQALKDEGNTIGYSKVTETDTNGGKKETYYSNFDNSDFNDERGLQYVYAYNGSLALYNRLAYTSFSLMRGKPIKEIIYSDSKKITNTDFIYKKRTDYIKAYDATVNEYGSSTENGPFADFGGVTYLALVNAHNLNFNSSFLTQKTITQDNVTTTDNYEYDNVYNLQPTFEKTTHASGDIIETKYQYPHEKGNQYLIDKNMIGIPLQTTVTQKQNDNDPGKTISKSEILYPTSQADANAKTAGSALPFSVLGFDLQNPDDAAKAQTEITYDLYDNKGNIFQYSVKGKPVTIIWGYNQSQPIAKIEGAAYNQVSAYVSGIIAASDADNTQGTDQSEQVLIGALDILRNNTALSAYQITTYTYNPLIGVTSITPPSGIREIYKYDSANRLESVKDINGNLLKEYQYKYKNENENTSYYNIIKSQTFTKNNCTPGTTPGTYTYTVPANKYTSTVSQADADQKAQNDINANGQEQANLFATCTPPTSCTFNPVTTGISATFTPSGSSIVYYNLNFSSSTKPYFNFDSKQKLLIGKIDPGCAPSSTFQIGKSEGGRYWMITIEPSGNFYLQLLNGSVNSGSFSISDSYSKNGSIN